MEKKYSYKFFQNTDCEYFPCHKNCNVEDFNCLFCYCPLHQLGDNCGGNFKYIGEKKIKDCTNCTFPHISKNYEKVIEKLKGLYE